MADTSATIIAASLSSEELEKSINKLVGNVALATELIRKDFDDTVNHVKKSLSSIGDIKINTGGSGTSKGGTGLKQVEQEAKSATASLDNFTKAQQVAIRTSSEKYRNADTLQTMNTQLDLLRERLREARSQYSSFVALASHATTTGDKGLYQFATEGVHKYGDEVRTLIPQIRGLQNAIQQMGDVIAPQGHTMQNYVNSLQKTNPELAKLNEQFKKGQSELQNQSTSYNNATQSAHQYTEEIRKQAQAIRETQQWKEKGYAMIGDRVYYDPERSVAPAKNRLSLEEQILNVQKEEEVAAIRAANAQRQEAAEKAAIEQETRKVLATEQQITAEQQKRSQPKTFASYDSLRESIAHVLGMQQSQIKLADTETASYNNLSTTLKQLKQAYDRLTSSERNSDQGKVLVASMHEVERAIQRIKAQAARPVSLESIIGINGKGGLSEKTLDDIAYKMQRLSSLRSGLNVETQKNEIRTVNAEYDRLKKKMDELMQKNQQMIGSNNTLGRSWNYMKNRLAFYFTVGAGTQFIKNLIEVRSQYEMNERALGILINSAERGTQIFNELSQMALVSPYTLIELSNAAKQLTAYDIAAKDVVDTTRRLADMASAVGVPMERLTYALGQIKAYGYLNSRDARMFANAGIPLVRELSKYYSELEGKVVSVGDVYDRMKKKAIDFNSVMAVVTKMTDEGGKFFDFQAKMADTLKVRLANLTLAWNNMLNDIGASQQGVLTSGIGILRDLFLHWQDIYGAIQRVVLAIGLWKGAQALALLAIGELNTKMGMQVLLGEKLQTRLSGLAGSTKNLVSGYAAAGAALLFVVADAIMTYQRNAEEIEKLNKVIVDGAKESANSIYEFIESAEMSYARLSARTGKLPKPDAEKTWDALREQIELSAISAKDIIPELIKIEDLNERVTKAFNLAERIAEANNKLIDLDGKLDISQDSILFGLFGEGLVEDIDDFNERLRISAQTEELYFKSTGSVITDVVQGLTGFFNDMKEKLGSSTEEAELEIKNFAHNAAEAIKDELGEEGLKDSIQVNEAVARVLKGIEQQFPQIKGKGKALFESIYNDIMAEEFEGAVDKQAYYYKLFLERLKKDHGSAFQGVTDDILKETHKWSTGQQNAINKTAEKVKEDLPLAAQSAIDQILNQLNNTDFKLRIVAEFATTTLDDVQKQFRERFIEKDALGNTLSEKDQTERQQKYGSLMIKNNESDLDYQERIKKEKQKQLDISKSEGDIISRNQGKTDAWSKAIVARATEAKKAADDTLSAINDIESGGYDFTTKKENTAASKAQKAAETELQKALKDELQLIDKVRSQYKKLTDAGATDGEALAMVTNQFANSLAHVNKVLGKNGIPLFDISKFAGTDNPNALLDMLKLQLDSAKIAKNIKPEEIKELEVKYSEIVVDAKAYNLTKITKGLNNELDRLKDEYELAVSLDADPELGNMFADWMGIDVNDLPRTASEYAERASKELNKYLKENKANVELPNLLNVTDDDLRAFEEMKVLTDAQLENVRKRVQQARELQRKEASDQIKDWDKLLEKYAEYETKVSKLQNDAVKERVTFAQQFGGDDDKSLALNLQTQILAATDQQEKQKLINQLQELIMSIAGNDRTKVNLAVAIDTKNKQDLETESFKEFQKSTDWIVATGDLANLSKAAIGGLISELEKYKKSAKNLDSKQIKQLNNALSKLYKEQRKNNPFKAIGNMLQQAKENAAAYNETIEDIQKQMEDLGRKSVGGLTDDEEKKLESLTKKWEELKQKQEDAGKIDATQWVSAINETVSAVGAAVGVFDDLAKAIGGVNASDVDKVFSILEKGGQGAAVGAQIGQGYGAIIGAVAGLAAGIITTFADQWSGNAGITEQIQKSEMSIKRLENAYKRLDDAVNEAYGSATIGAKKAVISNKELQLAELQRQLQLEQSRKSKNKDEAKIEELRGQIISLELDIKDATNDITNDLLGISSVGDAMETMMDAFIEALRSGEDAMSVFNKSVDDMIANMVKKMFTTKILQPWFDEQWSKIQQQIDERGKKGEEEIKKIQEQMALSDSQIVEQIKNGEIKDYEGFYHTTITQSTLEEYRKYLEKKLAEAQKNLVQDTLPTTDDIIKYAELLRSGQPIIEENMGAIRDFLMQLGLMNDTSDKNLSALQQGIQGITEDTAGAIEAYMNIVSQRVFEQNEYLMQIRDIIVGFDLDVQVDTMGQMLLQLQQSYQVQQAIQARLDGWSNANGMAVRVEMV